MGKEAFARSRAGLPVFVRSGCLVADRETTAMWPKRSRGVPPFSVAPVDQLSALRTRSPSAASLSTGSLE
jgi:hypothetical protein